MDTGPRSSRNVTVEYHDPSGLFNLVKPLLSEILPLRNLHWKSQTRPLRSIDSLHIDFVPTQSASEEQIRLNDGSQRRRHQIPGLRQTPYLKIYLLRCDDNETYKSTSRKLLREWIKTNASPPQSSSGSSSTTNQDNHDAFEWLILHVVSADADLPEKTSTSKWPGRTTSVLEKVKADFNGSSKSAVDRVAQLRLPRPGADWKSPELVSQLEDLVAKLKSSILTSFDLRVSQYEEDIKEKDSQRSLPGWNFCTFFILKEGLSLGFENVGLYEDALVGYDELSVGLDTVLRDQLRGVENQHGGTFLPYSRDLKAKVESILKAITGDKKEAEEDSDSDDEAEDDGSSPVLDGDPVALDPALYPLDPNKRPYREMILANDISVFDFRAYIFSRQVALLLKAAKANSIRKEPSSMGLSSQRQVEDVEDLTLLSEICQRAGEFISLGARILRHDLLTGLGQSEHKFDDALKEEVMDNFVCSWIYSAVSQILIQTSTPALELPKISLQTTSDLVKASIVSPFTESRPGVPRRSSSLLSGIPGRPAGQEVASGSRPYARPSLLSLKEDGSVQEKTGAVALASFRGDLYSLARSAMDNLGRKRKWGQGWHGLGLLYFEDEDDTDAYKFTEISLDEDEAGEKSQAAITGKTPKVLPDGIDAPAMVTATKSLKYFDAFFEKLTDQIFCHYVVANRTRSAELALADMALLKYRMGDYSTAASYFHQLTNFYGESKWEMLEGATLELYGRCLKHLNRTEDYVHALLKLLGLYARTARAKSKQAPQPNKRVSSLVPSSFSTVTRDRISNYVRELYNSSRNLAKKVTVQLADFFGSVTVDPQILHFRDKDGFQVQLSLRFVLGDSITVDSVRMRLVNATDTQHGELWLENEDEEVTIKSSPTRVLLDSSASVQGKYLVDHIEMDMGNIVFIRRYRFENAELASLQGIIDDAAADRPPPSVICYPPADAFEAKISPSSLIDLGEHRTVEVELKSGWNDISRGAIKLKPATAGLRLLIADVCVVSGSMNLRKDGTTTGQIEFEKFPPHSHATLRVPYTVEGSHNTLFIRLDVSYETAHGYFTYSTTSWVMSTLPVSVNVQDIFKDDVLFSKFMVSPAMMIPIRVVGCQIESPPAFEVQSGMQDGEIFDVFPKQPASLVYRIRQREDEASMTSESSPRSLRLTIEFTCVNEECLMALEDRLTADLATTSFRGLTRLLLPHLLTTLSTQWTARDLETIGLTREIEIFPFERFRWGAVMGAIGGELEKEVTQWLVAWHKANQTIPLPAKTPNRVHRKIVIPVDIPEVQIVHTAELVLKPPAGIDKVTASSSQRTTTSPGYWPVGSVIPAELHLRHTRRWCHPSRREAQANLTFSYEILAHPDVWLIGGRRRGNFNATEEEGREGRVFPIMLLPQRPGSLLLPGVDVKTFTTSGGSGGSAGGGDGGGEQRRQIPCEVDYRNHGEAVLVSPDLSKTTVSLGIAGAVETQGAGGGWLVDSQRRSSVLG
ncbi:hypothetical protein VTO42DRAFT_8420 [Malbranchea cinnamomea]